MVEQGYLMTPKNYIPGETIVGHFTTLDVKLPVWVEFKVATI